MRLALALGRTVGELLGGGPALSAAEFDLMADHAGRDGLPAERLEITTARAGARVCRAFGAAVQPAEILIPAAAPDKRSKLRAWLESLPPPKPEA